MAVALLIAGIVAYVAVLFLFMYQRPWNRRVYVKRRLLVEENGEVFWRTVRARVLLGGADSDRTVNPRYASLDEELAILQTWKGLLIVYRVDRKAGRQAGDQKIGSLEICRSWEELKAAVPAEVFEEVALAAGHIRPVKYREVPLEHKS
jgi:hypothetical protein